MKKLIDRSKFELCGKENPIYHTGESRYGQVYNCLANISRCNPLEYAWFFSEMDMGKKANIWWLILYLVCPWYHSLYGEIKFKRINLDMTLMEFINLILVIVVTLTGLGWIFAIWYAIGHPRYARKEYERKKMKKS